MLAAKADPQATDAAGATALHLAYAAANGVGADAAWRAAFEAGVVAIQF